MKLATGWSVDSSTCRHFFNACCGFILLLATLPAFSAVRNHSIEMEPVTAGPYPVACSNLAHDSEKLAQLGGDIDDYWSGANSRYLDELLLEPTSTLRISPRVPDEGPYPKRHGTVVDFAIIACYPTGASNDRPNYVLPDGKVIPRMQRSGQSPILPELPCFATFPTPAGCGQWPLLVFSHGLGSSPVDSKSLEFIVQLASYGYIVAAPFHGDDRFLRLKLEDLGDLFYLMRNFNEFVELQALRPFAVKAVIDAMLANSDFGNRINSGRIGGIGVSLGGETMALLLGAQLTDDLWRETSTQTVNDARIKAAVGYIPYAGQKYLSAFGKNNATAKNVGTPYLAISGTEDGTAPMYRMEQALNQFFGTRYQVALNGVGHTYETAYGDDVFGWVVPFLAMYLDPAGSDSINRDRMIRQQNVRGGIEDHLLIDYDAPSALVDGELLVEEFYNDDIKHYFVTASQGDKKLLDAGTAGRWLRTSHQFKAYAPPGELGIRPQTQAPVCRFYAPLPNNTHFFSAEERECQLLARLSEWTSEGIAFWINRATKEDCPVSTVAISRLYNNRWRENDSNHRYVSSRSLIDQMKNDNWIDEGVVMCAPQ